MISNKLKRTFKKFVSVLLCTIILIYNSLWMIPYNNEIAEEKDDNIIQTTIAKENIDTNRPIVTSRSGTIRRDKIEEVEKVEYTVYEFTINSETKLYFENQEKAELQKEYLIKNTDNVYVDILEITQDNKDNISDEFTINNTIENYILKYKKIFTSFPTISHRVTSTYGYRKSRGDFHSGIDLAGNYGDNIYAYKSGKVIKVQYSNVSYGNMVLIQHDDGSQSRYAHMSSIAVKLNQYVECGATIGYMGSTGNSTGNHLHFEIIINGKTVNPYSYIF